jgi:hypothetical protein
MGMWLHETREATFKNDDAQPKSKSKTKTKRVFVGHSNCSPLSKEESGIGRPCSGRRFLTIKEGENFVANLSKNPKFQEAVRNGDYCIDAPEDLLNPRKS